MERVDTITKVETKPLNDGRTLYLIFDSQGTEYSTTKRELAQVANSVAGGEKYAHLDYVTKTNDRGFTNNYLNKIEAVPDDLSLNPALQETMAKAQAAQAGPPPGLFDDAVPEPSASPMLDKDLNIAKAVGLKAGVEMMQYLPEGQRTPANIITAAEFFTNWLVSWRP